MKAELKPLFTWRSRIADSGLPPTTRLVALTLSLHMNERGDSCFPSLETQSEETGLSKTTVVKALRELEQTGYIVRTVTNGGKGGRGNVTHYRAVHPPPQLFTERTVQPRNSSSDAERTVHLTPKKGPASEQEDVSTEGVRAEDDTTGASPLAPSADEPNPEPDPVPLSPVEVLDPAAPGPKGSPGPEARAIAADFKAELRARGTTVFARDWHLRAAAVAQDLLGRSGVEPEDLRACIAWALSDPWWSGRVTTMEKIRDLMPQFQQHRGRPGARASPGLRSMQIAQELRRRGM